MTDAEKLQEILNYAKESFNTALKERHIIEASYYEKDEEKYDFEIVCYTHQMVSERSAFYHKVKQIIEEPEEYLKEKAWLEDCVERILATKKENNND